MLAWVAVGLAVLMILIIVIFASLNNRKKNSFSSQNVSLDNLTGSGGGVVKGGKFSDSVCGISFDLPAGLTKSLTKLPLPQEPLSEAVFDEAANKSVFSYICYDGKYTFDQFSGSSDLKVEQINVDGAAFSRAGNFVFFNKNNKLIIFQMFFTKNDVEPRNGYEEKLLGILRSLG